MNDNRKRPLIWSRRHCRIYSDPFHGSFGVNNQDLFKVISFQHGTPHPEYDDYFHMGLEPGVNEANAIRRNGIAGNAHNAHRESQTVPNVQVSPTPEADSPQRTFVDFCSSDNSMASDDCYADNGSCSMVKITPDDELGAMLG